MKKKISIILIIIVFIITAYFIGSGFRKEGAVYVREFAVSENGETITLTIGVTDSIGYVRKMEVKEQHGGKMYIDCYSAFGGINGSIGAKDTYTLPLDEDTSVISIIRNANCYEEVIRKNSEGIWEITKIYPFM